MDGNEDENFLKLCIERIDKITLRKKKPLNERQCANLLSHFRKCLYMLQDVLGPCNEGCGPLWKDLFRIVIKASLLLESCLRDDWCQAALIQHSNKEAFRELLLELEGWFHIICDKVRSDALISLEQVAKLKLCTALCPTEGDEVDKDQVFLQERLVNAIKKLPCDSNNFKLAKYLFEMMGCLSKVEKGELSTLQFPTKFHCPQSRYPPETLGDTGSSFVQVHATSWLGVPTATKTMKVQNVEMKKHFEKEACILGGLHHPNIIKFFYCGYVEDTKCLLFGMEKGARNLSNMLEKDLLTYTTKLDIMLQVASGMCYLHDMKVAHRDLKPANVILMPIHVPELHNDGYVVAKLVDFGISKIEVKKNPEPPTGDSVVGTPGYFAPEAIRVKKNEILPKVDALKVDVFSFGVICYEIFTQKKSPFLGLDRDALLVRLKEVKGQMMSNDMQQELRLLIEECWSCNPSKRPMFSNIHERLMDVKNKYFVAMSNKYEVSHLSIHATMEVEGWFKLLLKNFWDLLTWLANVSCTLFLIFYQGWLLGFVRIFFDDPIVTTSLQVNDISKLLKYPVGLKEKLLEFEKQLGKSDMLGIVGMGGVGKTTFVMALEERLHKSLKENISSQKVKDFEAKISKDIASFSKVGALNGGHLAPFNDIIFLPNMKDDIKNDDDHLKVVRDILNHLYCRQNAKDLKEGREILLKILGKEKSFLF